MNYCIISLESSLYEPDDVCLNDVEILPTKEWAKKAIKDIESDCADEGYIPFAEAAIHEEEDDWYYYACVFQKNSEGRRFHLYCVPRD